MLGAHFTKISSILTDLVMIENLFVPSPDDLRDDEFYHSDYAADQH